MKERFTTRIIDNKPSSLFLTIEEYRDGGWVKWGHISRAMYERVTADCVRPSPDTKALFPPSFDEYKQFFHDLGESFHYEYCREVKPAAVVWCRNDETGALAIYTRGEHSNDLVDFIGKLQGEPFVAWSPEHDFSPGQGQTHERGVCEYRWDKTMNLWASSCGKNGGIVWHDKGPGPVQMRYCNYCGGHLRDITQRDSLTPQEDKP